MGLFKSLNAHILSAIDEHSGTARLERVAFLGDQLEFTFTRKLRLEVAWSALYRIVAFRRELYAGDEVSLLLEFADSQVFEVGTSCPGWAELCAAIAALEGARPYGEWLPRALLAPVGQALDVYSRKH